jgi:hypothetical protein
LDYVIYFARAKTKGRINNIKPYMMSYAFTRRDFPRGKKQDSNKIVHRLRFSMNTIYPPLKGTSVKILLKAVIRQGKEERDLNSS